MLNDQYYSSSDRANKMFLFLIMKTENTQTKQNTLVSIRTETKSQDDSQLQKQQCSHQINLIPASKVSKVSVIQTLHRSGLPIKPLK